MAVYRYEDPTGGGDDVFLDIPENAPWAPPATLELIDKSDEPDEYEFNLHGIEEEG